ncbi:MAG TPA: hypothetical protein VFO60_05660 [Candidatus Dormibacteraeota bacterium]|nr:hypothetical protein [Candidatus Dormibacteraeota bacterium]
MSEQVTPGGQGWGVRVRGEKLPAFVLTPVEMPEPNGDPDAAPMAGADPGAGMGEPAAAAGFVEGTWVAGVGWVPADHPYATGRARPPAPQKRKRGLLSFGPTSLMGKIAFRAGLSASVSLVLFGTVGHSWIGALLHGHHGVTTPATIAGEPLVTTGPLADLSKTVDGYIGDQSFVGSHGGGFYAVPGAQVASYGVWAFSHSGTSLTGGDESDVVNEISNGAYQGTVKSESDSGVQYTCGNIAYAGRVGVACVWDDGDVAGFLVNFSDTDVDGVLSLTKIVRGAVEGQK